jgi:hypothetical protein
MDLGGRFVNWVRGVGVGDTGILVGVRAWRDHLAPYLRKVRNGTSVLVTSHDVVIAELRAPSAAIGRHVPLYPAMRLMCGS